jgi:hypothetical protein
MTLPAHRPVLLAEVLAAMGPARRAADATLGDGGHAEAMLDQGAEVLAIDRDPVAVARAAARLAGRAVTLVTGAFDDPDVVARVATFRPEFALFDLGVSSRQLDADALGFSFRPGVPLDMRMGGTGPTAADLLARAPVEELERIFRDFGDERRGGGGGGGGRPPPPPPPPNARRPFVRFRRPFFRCSVVLCSSLSRWDPERAGYVPLGGAYRPAPPPPLGGALRRDL